MKKILASVLLFLFYSTIVGAQEVWKERSEFYEVFNSVFTSAKNGNTKPLLDRYKEMEKKYLIFDKIIDGEVYQNDKELKRNVRLGLEQVTLIKIIIERKTYTDEILYGELIKLHNRYHKILLKGEEPSISKDLLKYYTKEEKKYLERKKIIYQENNWH